MRNKVIKKKNIKDLLREVSKEWNVYAPQRNLGKDIWIERLTKKGSHLDKALDNIALADEDIIISPKDIFFPQLESMFEFKQGNIQPRLESSAKLLFGIKPCDLKGILFVDDFFKRDFLDFYYLSRAQKRFIVVIGCITPPRPQACFCTSAGTGPFAEDGYDLQFIDAKDSYFVEVGSKKGEEFLAKYGKFFKDAKKDSDKIKNEIKLKARESIQLKVDFKKAQELMQQDDFIPQENYQRISQRCIWCGGCLYVCPTCTCFNVFDAIADNEGYRFRNWDTCVFKGYTREASGHNPRKEKWIRTSRRYEHKLKYDFFKTGISGCIGCGRCLRSCPVDIGISKFIQEITENRKII